MLKKIALLISFITVTAQAQKVISGTFEPAEDYSWVMLYKIKGNQQVYVVNGTIKDGKFQLSVPSTIDKGMMRLVYSMDEGKYIDFIYNQENLSFTCNPEDVEKTIAFENSKENKLYFNHLVESELLKKIADSLQVAYLTTDKNSKTAEEYERVVKKLTNIQDEYEQKSEQMIANHLIKAQRKFYSDKVIEDPQICMNTTKKHFFDYINFSDEYLKNSILLPEKIIEYIFYINTSDDVEVQNKIYQKSCLEVLEKANDDPIRKRELLEFLLLNFSNIKNVPTVDFLVNEYKKLQKDIQNPTFLEDIEDEMRLAIGKKAPNFHWGTKKKNSLYQQPKRKNYIIVFWSTTCPHCLNKMPKLYEYTKNNKDIMVIAVALEDDNLGFDYYSEKFKKWKNILSLGKWKNDIAKLYEIHSTPTYYILDEHKNIIATPEFLEGVENFLKKNTSEKE